MNQPERISVFGLGKLGCTMLACFAHKGWKVTGVDVLERNISLINEGRSPVYEPGVDEMLKENKSRISATRDPEDAINNTDVSFIIVPTPSTENGSFSTRFVEEVSAEIGRCLSKKNAYHLVVVTSTVLPGDMDHVVHLLERASGKKCGVDFGVCYNPDFIALGNIIHDFLNPDMVLIGQSDEKAGKMLESIHHRLVNVQPKVHRMNFHNAELSKIALNSYCTLKITFANVLAEICEHMPGGDVDAVTNAIGDDVRVGRKYIKGGLSYGGPCFPRDNRAFAYSANKFGTANVLAVKTDEINNYHSLIRIPRRLERIMKEKQINKIAVLGLTYKQDTTLVEESAVMNIIKSLSQKGIAVSAYDPAGIDEAKKELQDFDNISFFASVEECLKGKKLCLIGAPWQEFKKLDRDKFIAMMDKQPVIFDGCGIYNFNSDAELEYIRIGKNK
jgi:UDPglucose 6-dehydrogenase